MPNNPVQIVLNDEAFHRLPEPGQPPRPKDFYENNDQEFVRHRDALAATIQNLIDSLSASKYGPATYLKVQMRGDALAKSYRPVQWLFKTDQFPCVGAEAVGTLFFRAPLIYLGRLKQRILDAESSVRIATHQTTGERYPSPTIKRAEVSAIETIEIASPAGKRNFSTQSALDAFTDGATVSGYQVDLFESPGVDVIADDPTGRTDLFRSLERVLLSFGDGARTLFSTRIGRLPVLEIQLQIGTTPAIVDNRMGLVRSDRTPIPEPQPLDFNAERHEAVLRALADHPLVRSIRPPLRLQLVDQQTGARPEMAGNAIAIPEPNPEATYPIVGVIDSGVGEILEPWVSERFDFLDETEYDAQHGTMVAGLVSVGQLVNSAVITPERDGCAIYDIPLFPKGRFSDHYAHGFADFLGEVEQAVAEASRDHGVRIFNLSINATAIVEPYTYSTYAAELDRISDTYKVVFVNSAGNLPPGQGRAPWPKKPSEVVGYFASRTQGDTIYRPTESVRSISVGALNPPTSDPAHIEGAPTIYTRRGPGLQVGVKPDVAAYGGAGGTKPGAGTGLTSVHPDGSPTQVTGTSFAAPLIARSLAGLDAVTGGNLQPEALRAMMLHSAKTPEILTKRGLKDLPRQFAGYGQPASVRDMLETDDHQITLLFQSRLSIGEKKPVILRFPFAWPQSLVTNGACSGRAKLTLVYAPPLDPAFGAEFVRVNLEASLKQRQPSLDPGDPPRFTKQINAKYLPKANVNSLSERALINHGLKWWPTKQYEKNYNQHGESSEWRLEVTSLVRAEAEFPPEGVPFAVLLTIEDPTGAAPVFQQMQQSLRTTIANAQPLETVFRIRPRA